MTSRRSWFNAVWIGLGLLVSLASGAQAQLNFGDVPVGQSATLTSGWHCPYEGGCWGIYSYEVNGADQDQFTVSAESCLGPAPFGWSCTYTVTFTPKPPFGTKSATIRWLGVDPSQYLITELIGTAVAPGGRTSPGGGGGSVPLPPQANPPAAQLADIRILPGAIHGFQDCGGGACLRWVYHPIIKNFSSEWFLGVNVTARWGGQTAYDHAFDDSTLSPVGTCYPQIPPGIPPGTPSDGFCQAFWPHFGFDVFAPLPIQGTRTPPRSTSIEFTITWKDGPSVGGRRGPGSKRITVVTEYP